MTYNQLLEEYTVALNNELSATKMLDALLQGGSADESTLEAQTKQMIDSHAKSMDIYDQMQKFKL
ncbi:MAG: hypothetical protein Q7T40_01150 [Methylobacter sp.]|nr:hypothetical protein [Methylobacter sp.]